MRSQRPTIKTFSNYCYAHATVSNTTLIHSMDGCPHPKGLVRMVRFSGETHPLGW